MKRREFSKILFSIPFFINSSYPIPLRYFKSRERQKLMEARYYRKRDKNAVSCELCFRGCLIPEGKRGFCKNRENREGKLYSLVYYRPSALQVDPVEKEPMFHFLPGSKIFCTGTASCNFRCKHCHNYHLSHRTLEEVEFYFLTPKEIVNLAKKYECRTVSFTYNEPTVFFEYMFDIVKLAKEKGLKAIFHSNGAISRKPLEDILKIIDGVTIDLKAFHQNFYTEISSAYLEPVIESLRLIRKFPVWLEIVNLIIPTYNDNPSDIKKMVEWIVKELGEVIPVHFTRFFPSNNLRGLPPTPIATLEKAHQIAKEAGIKFVYIGNCPGHKYNSTFCPSCNEILIKRVHFEVLEKNIENSRCKFCNTEIPGIWN